MTFYMTISCYEMNMKTEYTDYQYIKEKQTVIMLNIL